MNKKAQLMYNLPHYFWGFIIGLIVGAVLMYLYLNNMLPIEPIENIIPKL